MSTEPNFIFVGPDKTGSTYIFEYLNKLRDLHIPAEKELWYFDRFYDTLDINHYKKNFVDGKINIEISHNYLTSPFAINNIFRSLANTTIVVCKRDPVERLVSQYKQLHKMGYAKNGFYQSITEFPVLLLNSLIGYHLAQISEEHYSRIRILDFSLLAKDEMEFQRSICHIIGVPHEPFSIGKINEAQNARSRALNHVLSKLAVYTRSIGFGKLVTALKTSKTMKRLMFKTTSDEAVISISEQERAALERFFECDQALLSDIERRIFELSQIV